MTALGVALASVAAIAVLMTATALLARRLGRVAIVDVTWGLLFVGVAWASAFAGAGGERSWLLAGLVTLWGGRLAWHIGRRARGAHEDPRYVELLSAVPEERRFRYAIRRVFLTQGLIAWFISLPLQVAATTDRPLGLFAWVGLGVWAVGLAFEAIGDAQLRAFKADPAHRGRIMDRGLWAWTRHPNYFGDATVWWGLWLIAAEAWPGVLTVMSPAAMTWFLVAVSGAKLLEKSMSKRPGYPEYMERTSGFFPMPPRRPTKEKS